MKSKMLYLLFVLLPNNIVNMNNNKSPVKDLNELGRVEEGDVFPYMAAILQKSTYLCSGALIDESWVLTGADSLFTIRESSRTVRVRLGTINYKKGGLLTPIKLVEIHPYFDDSKPLYDVALIKLASPVKLTPHLNPIRYLKRSRKVVATHFIVTAWPVLQHQNRSDMNTAYTNRILRVSHLHPTNPERCSEDLDTLAPDHNNNGSILCLDPGIEGDPCQRDTGAPVVLNGVLWGIISSWKSEDCDVEPIFVTLVSDVNVSSWMHSTISGHKWHKKQIISKDNLL